MFVLYSVYTAIYADKVPSPAHDVALYKLDQSYLNLKY